MGAWHTSFLPWRHTYIFSVFFSVVNLTQFFYQILSKISFLASKFVASTFDFKSKLCSSPMCLVNLYCLVFLLGHLWSGGSGGLKKCIKKAPRWKKCIWKRGLGWFEEMWIKWSLLSRLEPATWHRCLWTEALSVRDLQGRLNLATWVFVILKIIAYFGSF